MAEVKQKAVVGDGGQLVSSSEKEAKTELLEMILREMSAIKGTTELEKLHLLLLSILDDPYKEGMEPESQKEFDNTGNQVYQPLTNAQYLYGALQSETSTLRKRFYWVQLLRVLRHIMWKLGKPEKTTTAEDSESHEALYEPLCDSDFYDKHEVPFEELRKMRHKASKEMAEVDDQKKKSEASTGMPPSTPPVLVSPLKPKPPSQSSRSKQPTRSKDDLVDFGGSTLEEQQKVISDEQPEMFENWEPSTPKSGTDEKKEEGGKKTFLEKWKTVLGLGTDKEENKAQEKHQKGEEAKEKDERQPKRPSRTTRTPKQRNWSSDDLSHPRSSTAEYDKLIPDGSETFENWNPFIPKPGTDVRMEKKEWDKKTILEKWKAELGLGTDKEEKKEQEKHQEKGEEAKEKKKDVKEKDVEMKEKAEEVMKEKEVPKGGEKKKDEEQKTEEEMKDVTEKEKKEHEEKTKEEQKEVSEEFSEEMEEGEEDKVEVEDEKEEDEEVMKEKEVPKGEKKKDEEQMTEEEMKDVTEKEKKEDEEEMKEEQKEVSEEFSEEMEEGEEEDKVEVEDEKEEDEEVMKEKEVPKEGEKQKDEEQMTEEEKKDMTEKEKKEDEEEMKEEQKEVSEDFNEEMEEGEEEDKVEVEDEKEEDKEEEDKVEVEDEKEEDKEEEEPEKEEERMKLHDHDQIEHEPVTDKAPSVAWDKEMAAVQLETDTSKGLEPSEHKQMESDARKETGLASVKRHEVRILTPPKLMRERRDEWDREIGKASFTTSLGKIQPPFRAEVLTRGGHSWYAEDEGWNTKMVQCTPLTAKEKTLLAVTEFSRLGQKLLGGFLTRKKLSQKIAGPKGDESLHSTFQKTKSHKIEDLKKKQWMLAESLTADLCKVKPSTQEVIKMKSGPLDITSQDVSKARTLTPPLMKREVLPLKTDISRISKQQADTMVRDLTDDDAAIATAEKEGRESLQMGKVLGYAVLKLVFLKKKNCPPPTIDIEALMLLRKKKILQKMEHK